MWSTIHYRRQKDMHFSISFFVLRWREWGRGEEWNSDTHVRHTETFYKLKLSIRSRKWRRQHHTFLARHIRDQIRWSIARSKIKGQRTLYGIIASHLWQCPNANWRPFLPVFSNYFMWNNRVMRLAETTRWSLSNVSKLNSKNKLAWRWYIFYLHLYKSISLLR